LKTGESNIHMINGLTGCPLHVTMDGRTVVILPNEMHIYEAISAKDYNEVKFETKSGDGACQKTRSYIEPVIHAKNKEVCKNISLKFS
jgi:hypothetical protein